MPEKETIERAVACVESCRTKKNAEGLSGFKYSGGGGEVAAGDWCTTTPPRYG